MAIRVVRLGSPRAAGEGVRLGTVRHPPRGVPKSEYRSRGFYDVWLPELAPGATLVKAAQGAKSNSAWRAFERKYRSEMKHHQAAHPLDLPVALSLVTDIAVGCYCEQESRCHRSVLRSLLEERGASLG